MSERIREVICDRCGINHTYINIKATNGMVAYSWDLCHSCFQEVNNMMLNWYNSRKTPFRDKDEG